MAMTVWSPDDGDEANSKTVENARNPELVAEDYAEERFASRDYPMEQRVHVRDHDGVIHVFDVETEVVPHFHARRVKSGPGEG